VFGHLSDSFLGRKGALQLACTLNAVFALLTSIAPNYSAYAALRVLTGFSNGSVGFCSFVLANEPIGPSRRGVAGMSAFYFFSGGVVLLAGVAAIFQSSWRLLYVVASLASLVYLVAVLPFVSESPRWYLVRGRADDAIRVLRDIASTNADSIQGPSMVFRNGVPVGRFAARNGSPPPTRVSRERPPATTRVAKV
jgi:OCT family organic cation transporter-like MFS transporter 4/5